MCRLAAAESWCWRIPCTTCGCGPFRSALDDLSHGLHPFTPEWRCYGAGARRRPPAVREVDSNEELADRFARTLTEASLRRIASACPWPDWLGFLGLTLAALPMRVACSRSLTVSWAGQLVPMCHSRAGGSALERCLADEVRRLFWQDLKEVEYEVLPEFRVRPPNDDAVDRQSAVERLLERCARPPRVCPTPTRWAQMWSLLPDPVGSLSGRRSRSPRTASKWFPDTSLGKRRAFIEQIEWADRYEALARVEAFLLSLEESEWEHSAEDLG